MSSWSYLEVCLKIARNMKIELLLEPINCCMSFSESKYLVRLEDCKLHVPWSLGTFVYVTTIRCWKIQGLKFTEECSVQDWSHTYIRGCEFVTNISDCDWHQGFWLTTGNVTNFRECYKLKGMWLTWGNVTNIMGCEFVTFTRDYTVQPAQVRTGFPH